MTNAYYRQPWGAALHTKPVRPDADYEPTITVARAAQVLGVSESTIRQAIKDGDITSHKIGERVIIPTAAFLAKYSL